MWFWGAFYHRHELPGNQTLDPLQAGFCGVPVFVHMRADFACKHVYVYVCAVYTYIYIYVYINIHTHMYIHIFTYGYRYRYSTYYACVYVCLFMFVYAP